MKEEQIIKTIFIFNRQTMTEKQLQQFTTNAASAFSSSQRDALSSTQQYALEQAIRGLKYTKRNSSQRLFPST